VTRLPVIAGTQIIKALKQIGFDHIRTKGSHAILRNLINGKGVTVPLHDPVKRGTLAAILRQVGTDAETFLKLLDSKK
jgi:predicted RNA binding protein YcfA (HicA-like mRNA interferase family)